jgi:hypothetical protein
MFSSDVEMCVFLIVYSLLGDSPVEISPRHLRIRLVSKGIRDTSEVGPVVAPSRRKSSIPVHNSLKIWLTAVAPVSRPRDPEREKLCPTQG